MFLSSHYTIAPHRDKITYLKSNKKRKNDLKRRKNLFGVLINLSLHKIYEHLFVWFFFVQINV